jgi:hypothetical protein
VAASEHQEAIMADHSFRPAHVVTMVVALCAAAVLTPVAVHAATGSAVNITDSINAGSKARVTAKGTLWTNETDPLTGKLARVTADGKRLVGDGAGPLSTDMASPEKPWNQINDITMTSGDPQRVLYVGLGPVRLNLTSLTVGAEGGSGSYKVYVQVYISDANAGDCDALTGANFSAADRLVFMVPAGNTVSLNYPSPLVYSVYAGVGKRYCVDISSSPGAATLHVSASGFLS